MHFTNRILILDWDIHHGNGIQHMFDEDPKVLYISLHRYDQGNFFPNTQSDADFNQVGLGAGKGFNVNIPWNYHKMTDTEYLAAFTNVILPISYEYAPQLILICAGFDAAKDDPLGGIGIFVDCIAFIIYHHECIFMVLTYGSVLCRVQIDTGMLRSHDQFAYAPGQRPNHLSTGRWIQFQGDGKFYGDVYQGPAWRSRSSANFKKIRSS